MTQFSQKGNQDTAFNAFLLENPTLENVLKHPDALSNWNNKLPKLIEFFHCKENLKQFFRLFRETKHVDLIRIITSFILSSNTLIIEKLATELDVFKEISEIFYDLSIDSKIITTNVSINSSESINNSESTSNNGSINNNDSINNNELTNSDESINNNESTNGDELMYRNESMNNDLILLNYKIGIASTAITRASTENSRLMSINKAKDVNFYENIVKRLDNTAIFYMLEASFIDTSLKENGEIYGLALSTLNIQIDDTNISQHSQNVPEAYRIYDYWKEFYVLERMADIDKRAVKKELVFDLLRIYFEKVQQIIEKSKDSDLCKVRTAFAEIFLTGMYDSITKSKNSQKEKAAFFRMAALFPKSKYLINTALGFKVKANERSEAAIFYLTKVIPSFSNVNKFSKQVIKIICQFLYSDLVLKNNSIVIYLIELVKTMSKDNEFTSFMRQVVAYLWNLEPRELIRRSVLLKMAVYLTKKNQNSNFENFTGWDEFQTKVVKKYKNIEKSYDSNNLSHTDKIDYSYVIEGVNDTLMSCVDTLTQVDSDVEINQPNIYVLNNSPENGNKMPIKDQKIVLDKDQKDQEKNQNPISVSFISISQPPPELTDI